LLLYEERPVVNYSVQSMKVGVVFVANIKATSLARNEPHDVKHHVVLWIKPGLKVLISKRV